MMNEVLDILADIPPMLAASWVAWLGAGLVLTIWYRRARTALEEQQTTARAMARAQSGSRPVAARSHQPSPLSHGSRSHVTPSAVKGDPFADLAQIFDEGAPAPGHRTPDESAAHRN